MIDSKLTILWGYFDMSYCAYLENVVANGVLEHVIKFDVFVPYYIL